MFRGFTEFKSFQFYLIFHVSSEFPYFPCLCTLLLDSLTDHLDAVRRRLLCRRVFAIFKLHLGHPSYLDGVMFATSSGITFSTLARQFEMALRDCTYHACISSEVYFDDAQRKTFFLIVNSLCVGCEWLGQSLSRRDIL